MAGCFRKMNNMYHSVQLKGNASPPPSLPEAMECCQLAKSAQCDFLTAAEQPVATQGILLSLIEADCIPVSHKARALQRC